MPAIFARQPREIVLRVYQNPRVRLRQQFLQPFGLISISLVTKSSPQRNGGTEIKKMSRE